MKHTTSVRTLCEAGVIGALYVALTLLLQPISFGPIQVRVAEALTILPVFTPSAIVGLTVGCAISNALCIAVNPAGAWDVLFGSCATLIAALLTYACRHVRIKGVPWLSAFPPVLLNGLVVGLELSMVYFDFSLLTFAVCALEVAVGEAIAAVGGGLLLYQYMPHSLFAKQSLQRSE